MLMVEAALAKLIPLSPRFTASELDRLLTALIPAKAEHVADVESARESL